jgi:hypothetical protein
MSRKFLDADHPFFRPVWRRWATALVPLCWAVAEISMGNTGWAAAFGAVGAYAFWVLIVKGPTAG